MRRLIVSLVVASSLAGYAEVVKKPAPKPPMPEQLVPKLEVPDAAAVPAHNAVLKDLQVLCVRRSWPKWMKNKRRGPVLRAFGFPSNHEVETVLNPKGYENEIVIYTPSTGEFKTVYKPDGPYFVGHVNLHWNGQRLLFSQSDEDSFKIYEINTDGSGLRRVSKLPEDIDCVNPCYLPDGRIVFNSTAPLQSVPCWCGEDGKFITNLYVMNADGSGVRRLTFDQDIDFYPSVRHNGQVVYTRWDYTGINRTFLRPVMSMNPDGTNQRTIYGSNSWFANGMYYPKELPGSTGRFLCVITGYHGSNRSGVLAVADTNEGEREGVGVTLVTGHKEPVVLELADEATALIWPQYMTPTPVTGRHFLASAWRHIDERKIGIYLADMDNTVSLVHEEEGVAFFEPIPLVQRPVPPAHPDKVDLSKTDATIYIQDIHAGPGLKGVPRGVVKRLRVVAYDFGYIGSAGMDDIGIAGPWEAMRILGTTEVHEDGSAMFKVPANTPIAFQPLDEKGRAVQLMRTWTTAMPGESLSCIGCHESAYDAPLPVRTLASQKPPAELDGWYGPARGFDFEREVQPVLNRYCVSCHNQDHKLDLRAEKHFPDYEGLRPGWLEYKRLHSQYVDGHGGKVRFTPTYEALVPYIRRVNVGDDVSLLEPGEYLADTSELIQVIKEGHKGITMDAESWSRLYTWIDLNGPCHGTWPDVYNEPLPGNANERRWELAERYGGPAVNPDTIPETPKYDETPVTFKKPKVTTRRRVAFRMPKSERKTIDLGGGHSVELVRVGKSWLMGACEISNGQFRQFDPDHTSRYYVKRHDQRDDDKGWDMDAPELPAVRVSWNRAMAFCEWLSKKSGLNVTLPTEEQWEKACLAGRKGRYHFEGDDFSPWENLADKTFASVGFTGRCECPERHFIVGGYGNCNLVPEGVTQADRRYADGGVVTMPVGSYKPNALGLHDMHGNACEWTLTDYAPGEKVVKGGSWFDQPSRAHVDIRRGYAPWHNVFNAGFRVVANE